MLKMGDKIILYLLGFFKRIDNIIETIIISNQKPTETAVRALLGR